MPDRHRACAAVLSAIALANVGMVRVWADSSGQVVLTARMTAEEEVPNPGPPGARGTALITIDEGAQQLCYQVSYRGISKPTAGHIHRGAQRTAGPVVVDLDIAKNGDKGCRPAERGVLHDLAADPAGHYVNLHTTDYPDGAMRGQLHQGPLTAPGGRLAFSRCRAARSGRPGPPPAAASPPAA